LGHEDRDEREGRAADGHQLRVERQLSGVPRRSSEEVREHRFSRRRVGRAARALRRLLHAERDERRLARRDGRPRRLDVDLAELRIP
jgi:hypothetical protein